MRIQQQIEEKLHYFFQPTHLEVINESHQHNVPANSETHFKVILASKKFRNQRLLQQHQQVYQLLAEEMKGGIHALTLHTYSPEKWETQPTVANSPTCLGGGTER